MKIQIFFSLQMCQKDGLIHNISQTINTFNFDEVHSDYNWNVILLFNFQVLENYFYQQRRQWNFFWHIYKTNYIIHKKFILYKNLNK